MPVCEAPWLKRQVSFSSSNPNWGEWRAYVQDIVDYVKEGQDPNLPDDIGWQIRINSETRWFHVPWMSYDGQRGREFIHGLTNELSTALPRSTRAAEAVRSDIPRPAIQFGRGPLFETWSVGMYNPCGGWAIGQVFPASGVPAVHTQDRRILAAGLPFPKGTLVIKILNTTADDRAFPI